MTAVQQTMTHRRSAALVPVTALTFLERPCQEQSTSGAAASGGGDDSKKLQVLLLAGAGSDVRTYELQKAGNSDSGEHTWQHVASQAIL